MPFLSGAQHVVNILLALTKYVPRSRRGWSIANSPFCPDPDGYRDRPENTHYLDT
ncbi:MAG: hypothetical protein AAFO69_06285 [Bacteroidota bacterium]